MMVCCLPFNFVGVVWFWMLLIDSGNELCGRLPALLQGVDYGLPNLSLPNFPVFVY
jgi:hypothetical protein